MKFNTDMKFSTFLLEIVILVSSEINTGCDKEFILRGSSSTYILQQRP